MMNMPTIIMKMGFNDCYHICTLRIFYYLWITRPLLFS